MALIGSLAMTEIYAQQTIVACNGKTYKQARMQQRQCTMPLS